MFNRFKKVGIKKFNVLILFRLACHEGDEVGHCSEEEDAGEDGSLDRQEEGGAQTAGSVGLSFSAKTEIFES